MPFSSSHELPAICLPFSLRLLILFCCILYKPVYLHYCLSPGCAMASSSLLLSLQFESKTTSLQVCNARTYSASVELGGAALKLLPVKALHTPPLTWSGIAISPWVCVREERFGDARPRMTKSEVFQIKAKASSVTEEAATASLTESTDRVETARKSRKTDSKKKLVKDRDTPKRPPSAYFIFMETFRKTFKAENPDVKVVTASAKAGGEKWLQLSEQEKAPYIAEAAARRAKYEEALVAYKDAKAAENDV